MAASAHALPKVNISPVPTSSNLSMVTPADNGARTAAPKTSNQSPADWNLGFTALLIVIVILVNLLLAIAFAPRETTPEKTVAPAAPTATATVEVKTTPAPVKKTTATRTPQTHTRQEAQEPTRSTATITTPRSYYRTRIVTQLTPRSPALINSIDRQILIQHLAKDPSVVPSFTATPPKRIQRKLRTQPARTTPTPIPAPAIAAPTENIDYTKDPTLPLEPEYDSSPQQLHRYLSPSTIERQRIFETMQD